MNNTTQGPNLPTGDQLTEEGAGKIEGAVQEVPVEAPRIQTEDLTGSDPETLKTTLESFDDSAVANAITDIQRQAVVTMAFIKSLPKQFLDNHFPVDTIERYTQAAEHPKESVGRAELITTLENSLSALQMIKFYGDFYRDVSNAVESKRPFYHVSSIEADKLQDGSNFVLQPAGQKARGVFAADVPILGYLGGSEQHARMKSCVVFNFPVDYSAKFDNYGTVDNRGLIVSTEDNRGVAMKDITLLPIDKESLGELGAIDLDKIPEGMPIYFVASKETKLEKVDQNQ